MFSNNGKSCKKLFMLFGKGLKKPLIAPIGIAFNNEVILGSIGIILKALPVSNNSLNVIKSFCF